MNTTDLRLKPLQQLVHSNLLLHPKNPFQIHQTRCYKRRRIKRTARCNFSLLEPFQNFLSSQNSLDFIAPILGLASGLTLYVSHQFKSDNNSFTTSNIGEWILFASPTPFNRFVFLRCPSISFEGSGRLLEDVNERLVEEDRHFVKLSSGRIRARAGGIGGLDELEYQRVCVSTQDGGVISIDWPANLELSEEHGLDTTLLLVPGTTEGSMCEDVRSFVYEALVRGFFPLVMNPRGCAGSPLTTARLFTAADSDDISTAIQFVNKERPWTSLMGIGWGYGANMLTKYLADVGERTPLTAAACINNPFDLEEATRSSPYHIALDRKLTGGLIDILRSNKELFQGRAKGFDVEKALMAKSVRDFEKAISMISYGFEEIEDFYSQSSTRGVVGNVKIPVLYIQNDDGTVPLFSIPRSVIAENPFTSLLLCSCMPSGIIDSSRAAISWCQNLAIEWLSAVELGLLKGRHPLLKDVDVTFNPSKGLTLVEGRRTSKKFKPHKFLDLSLTDANGYTIDPINEMPEDSNTAVQSRSRPNSHRNLKLEEALQEAENGALQEAENGALQQTGSVDAELVKEEVTDNSDTETGEVLQTAQVVMNMLDVTMPGALAEEEKKKVLTAVGQGETLLKALQDAVPEDVRGKLTTAVSGILQAQHTNLKLERLLGIGKIPSAPSGIKSKIQEKSRESDAEAIPKDPCPSDEMKKADDLADGSSNDKPGSEKSVTVLDPQPRSFETLNKSSELGQHQTMSNQQGDNCGSSSKSTSDLGNNFESDEVGKENAPDSGIGEKGLEKSAKPNLTCRNEKAEGTEREIVDQDGGTPQIEIRKESNAHKNEEKTLNSSSDQSRTVSGNIADVAPSPAESSTDSQPKEREGSDDHKMESNTMPSVPDQNKPTVSDSNPPSFSVAEALDALTGMDDSTQVAVNSVFGVIENMISQLEEEKDDENKTQDGDKIEDKSTENKTQDGEKIEGKSTENKTQDGEKIEGKSTDSTCMEEDATSNSPLNLNGKNDLGSQSDISNDKHGVNGVNPQNIASTGWVEEEPAKNPTLYSENGSDDSQGSTSSNYKYKEGIKNNNLVGGKFLADYADRHVNSIPLYVSANSYRDYIQNEYLQRYLLSKMPKSKPLDLDTTTTLFLDYFPEDGQWKLLEQPGTIGESIHDVTTDDGVFAKVDGTDNYIEPSYVLLDSEKQQETSGDYSTVDKFQEHVENGNGRLEGVMQFVKGIILNALRVEIDRKLSADGMKEMESDLASELELVANAVALAIGHDKGTVCLQDNLSIEGTTEKVGTLQGEDIVRAIASAVLSTRYLRRVLPIGVIIGSSLAALRKYFNVGTRHDNALKFNEQTEISGEKDPDSSSLKQEDLKLTIGSKCTSMINTRNRELEEAEIENKKSDSVMVGAVTAALGASALLVQQQNSSKCKDTAESSLNSLKDKVNNMKEVDKVDEELSERNQNIAASLAEKAISVAAPVVPTKEDGEVDQERLVAMLAELGQKGGLLKLVGKVALLWGGIRGAMSLTDRLISFLHLADRPLYQRIIGFAGMVLVLWSPVIVPLLPTLVQSWTTHTPSKFAELCSIIGLYTAVMILVMQWGKRIRGYEDPLEEYGLDLTKPTKIQNFFISLIGGTVIVLSIQSVNALLGCVSFCWPPSLSTSSVDAMTYLRVCGRVIMLAGQGIITATGLVLVEELLFRAWLPEEIASDLGYHQGIIISGLVFSICQRSLWAIPGLWLFSFALAGFRQRSRGSLSNSIGLHAGIMASSFILQKGGFLTYKPNYPLWVTGTRLFQPFSGIVGLAFASILAIILYPRQPLQKHKKEVTE